MKKTTELFKTVTGNSNPDCCRGDHRRSGIFFLVPSHTSVSSISGLGIVLSNFVPLPLSAITMIPECGTADHRFCLR